MTLMLPSRLAGIATARAGGTGSSARQPNADDTLLRRYANDGCETAFAQIVERHAGWVYQTCRRSLRHDHLAEDATQAVFILLSRKATSIKPGTHLGGWLFQACRYVLADLRKHHARYQRRLETARDMAMHRFSDSCNGEATPSAEWSAALDEAIARLREGDRQTILMHFYEGLSVQQMAAQLDITQDAAKKRLTRALSRLRKQLAGKIRLAGAGKRAALPLTAMLLLLRAGASQAAPAGLVTAVAKATTVPGLSSVLAEMIAAGVRQATLHATNKLLAALAVTATAPLVIVVAVSQSPRPEPAPSKAPIPVAALPANQFTGAISPTTRAPFVSFSTPSLGGSLLDVVPLNPLLHAAPVLDRSPRQQPLSTLTPPVASRSALPEAITLSAASPTPLPSKKATASPRAPRFSVVAVAAASDSSATPKPPSEDPSSPSRRSRRDAQPTSEPPGHPTDDLAVRQPPQEPSDHATRPWRETPGRITPFTPPAHVGLVSLPPRIIQRGGDLEGPKTHITTASIADGFTWRPPWDTGPHVLVSAFHRGESPQTIRPAGVHIWQTMDAPPHPDRNRLTFVTPPEPKATCTAAVAGDLHADLPPRNERGRIAAIPDELRTHPPALAAELRDDLHSPRAHDVAGDDLKAPAFPRPLDKPSLEPFAQDQPTFQLLTLPDPPTDPAGRLDSHAIPFSFDWLSAHLGPDFDEFQAWGALPLSPDDPLPIATHLDAPAKKDLSLRHAYSQQAIVPEPSIGLSALLLVGALACRRRRTP